MQVSFKLKDYDNRNKIYSIGTLMGITNMLASIPGFVGPMFVGWITNNNVRLNDDIFFLLIRFCFK